MYGKMEFNSFNKKNVLGVIYEGSKKLRYAQFHMNNILLCELTHIVTNIIRGNVSVF